MENCNIVIMPMMLFIVSNKQQANPNSTHTNTLNERLKLLQSTIEDAIINMPQNLTRKVSISIIVSLPSSLLDYPEIS